MTKDQELLLALRERDEAQAEASRLDDEAIYQRGLYESARAEVERLKGLLTEQGILLSRLGIEKPELDALVQASWRTVAERQREACAEAVKAMWGVGDYNAEVQAVRATPLVTEEMP